MVSKIITILYTLIEVVKRIVVTKRHNDVAQEIKEKDDKKTKQALSDLLR